MVELYHTPAQCLARSMFPEILWTGTPVIRPFDVAVKVRRATFALYWRGVSPTRLASVANHQISWVMPTIPISPSPSHLARVLRTCTKDEHLARARRWPSDDLKLEVTGTDWTGRQMQNTVPVMMGAIVEIAPGLSSDRRSSQPVPYLTRSVTRRYWLGVMGNGRAHSSPRSEAG